jgi:hypothetical protein
MPYQPEHAPGEPAPAAGTYEQVNVFGHPNGIRVCMSTGNRSHRRRLDMRGGRSRWMARTVSGGWWIVMRGDLEDHLGSSARPASPSSRAASCSNSSATNSSAYRSRTSLLVAAVSRNSKALLAIPARCALSCTQPCRVFDLCPPLNCRRVNRTFTPFATAHVYPRRRAVRSRLRAVVERGHPRGGIAGRCRTAAEPLDAPFAEPVSTQRR